MSTASPETAVAGAPASKGWSPASIVGLLLSVAIAAVCCFREIYENDAGWHLALGRIFATKGLVFENALAWTTGHFHWYPTSWLYDWISWRSFAAWGPGGIQGLTLVLMLLTIAG